MNPPVSPTVQSLGLDRLSVGERIVLVQELWDSIATSPEQIPLTEGQRLELERRLAAHQAKPHEAIPWEQVKAEALKRIRQ